MKTVVIAAFLAFAAPATAVVVNPGEQGFLFGTTVAAQPDLAGIVLADMLTPYSITIAELGLTSSGNVQSRVVRSNTTGLLDFYWRIIPDTRSQLDLSAFSVEPWVGSAVDTDFRPDGLGSYGPNRFINNLQNPFPAYDLNWYFDPTSAGAETHFFFARTNATNFARSSEYFISVTGEGPNGSPIYFRSDNGLTYAPAAVPEPATWAMLIMGFGLVGAVCRRRTVVSA